MSHPDNRDTPPPVFAHMPKFVPRQRKHKVLARKQKERDHAREERDSLHEDSNAAEIIPTSKAEKEQRRLRAREELLAQHSKPSSKKKKRLDHYIDTKLRKEENLELIKKLAAERVDTTTFHSSRRLGNATRSSRDGLNRVAEGDAHGFSSQDSTRRSAQQQDSASTNGVLDAEDEDEDDASSANTSSEPGADSDTSRGTTTVAPPTKVSAPLAFGSGLKRPLAIGTDGQPVIPKRQRIARADANVPTTLSSSEGTLVSAGSILAEDPEPDWEGFSDDDGAEDGSGTSNPAPESDESEDSDQNDSASEHDAKVSNFKAWAVQQRNNAIGFTPSVNLIPEMPDIPYTPQEPEIEPLPPELEVPNQVGSARLVHAVHVERSQSIAEARSALPVVAEEQKIMEAIHNNDVVVICGTTGSGKTSQVPQFLFEAGYGDPKGPTPGLIGVTQPRRVAAVSMAERVGDELGQHKVKVAYQIRFDHSTVKRETAIKFMTDGILLREISQDVSLSKYSAIIIDEAHERSVNTDILIGMLSRIVYNIRAANTRRDQSLKPLKLIIMSATMRISDFLENVQLFPRGAPPLVDVEGRRFPVTMHFSRQTKRDYVDEAFTKVTRGHRKLPPGGMLVFLTGQNEITALQRRLKEAFADGKSRQPSSKASVASTMEMSLEAEDLLTGGQRHLAYDGSDDEDFITGLEDADIGAEEDEFDISRAPEDMQQDATLKLHVLPLYSQLPTNEQLRIFKPPPDGSRLIVLATNVAETSLTIPGIRYVFDCGRAKEKRYDARSGVQRFDIDWISKASAAQRAGRAGRTGPGHCYRLYSSALYEAYFAEHTEPEILRTPLEDVVLQLKSMGLAKVVNFPFPTAPEQKSLEAAEKLLRCLGALSMDGKVTALGQKLTAFPVSARFSRMLVAGRERACLPLIVALVAALSVPEIFTPQGQVENAADEEDDEEKESRRKAYNAAQAQFSNLEPSADAIKLFSAFCAYSWEAHLCKQNQSALHDFCSKYFLRAKAMKEASQLRQQLAAMAERDNPGSVGPWSLKVPTPTEVQLHLLRTITAAGFIDQVAIRADLSPIPPETGKKPTKAIDVPYMTLFATHRRDGDAAGDGLVYIHPTSVLSRRSKAKLPQYLVYSHLQRSSTGKVRMFPLTPVSGAQLAVLARDTPLLQLGKPVGKVAMHGQDERICECLASLVGDKGSTPWPLRSWRVRQKRVPGRGWVVQEILDS